MLFNAFDSYVKEICVIYFWKLLDYKLFNLTFSIYNFRSSETVLLMSFYKVISSNRNENNEYVKYWFSIDVPC